MREKLAEDYFFILVNFRLFLKISDFWLFWKFFIFFEILQIFYFFDFFLTNFENFRFFEKFWKFSIFWLFWLFWKILKILNFWSFFEKKISPKFHLRQHKKIFFYFDFEYRLLSKFKRLHFFLLKLIIFIEVLGSPQKKFRLKKGDFLAFF